MSLPDLTSTITSNQLEQHDKIDASISNELSKNKLNGHRVTDSVNDYLSRRHNIHEFSVTATPKPATINLNDIFITVKTTKLYHNTRLALIIKTWFQLAKDQVS